MNLKELEYVVAIADEKSLTKAAERLFITPSALTQQVLRLENELHAPLFIRSRSGWQPTEAGEIYLEAARKILFIRQDAYNRLQDQIQRSAYSLTIGLPPERGTDMFSRIYAPFRERFPDVTLQLRETSVHTPQEDFLDVEWEFVAGGIESPHVRKLLKDWTADEKALPTLAICGNSAPENVAAALYLPQPLYDRQVPIFVYQKETATILEIARRSSRYRSVYPFGMMCESYDATLKQRIRKAKRINYVYNHFTDAKKAAKKAADELNEKFDFKTFAAGFEIADWPDDKIDKYWNDQSLAFQWSNIYAANAIPAKLRSLGIDPCRPHPLDGQEVETAARVEHNRWNVERLLMGYRPATTAERERANDDDEYNEMLKKKYFIHINIAPYGEIPEETKENDRILTRFLYRVEQ